MTAPQWYDDFTDRELAGALIMLLAILPEVSAAALHAQLMYSPPAEPGSYLARTRLALSGGLLSAAGEEGWMGLMARLRDLESAPEPAP